MGTNIVEFWPGTGGKRITTFIGQFSTVGDLPPAAGYVDGIAAWVVGDRSIYVVDAGTWTKVLTGGTVNTTTNLASFTVAQSAALKALFVLGRTTVGDAGAGAWIWDGTDHTTEVSRDPLAGVYQAPLEAPTGASGAWRRLDYTPGRGVRSGWFGAIGDYDIDTLTGTDNTTAVQAMIDFVSQNNETAYVDEGWYLVGTIYWNGTRKASLELENISGTFVVGETVTGATSGATGVIAAIDVDELFFSSRNATAWVDDEVVTGGTSGATATHDFDWDAVTGSTNFRGDDPSLSSANYGAGFSLIGANPLFNPLDNDDHGREGTVFVHKDGVSGPVFACWPHLANAVQPLYVANIAVYGGDQTTALFDIRRVSRQSTMERIYGKSRAEVTQGLYMEACWRFYLNSWNLWGYGGSNYTTHGKSVLDYGTGFTIRTPSGSFLAGGVINQVILHNFNVSFWRRGGVFGWMDNSSSNVLGPILIMGGGMQQSRYENWVFGNGARGVNVIGSHSEWGGHNGMLIFNGASDITIGGYTTLTADGDAYKPTGTGRGGYGEDHYSTLTDKEGYSIAVGYLPSEYSALGASQQATNIRLEDIWFPLSYRAVFVDNHGSVGPVSIRNLRFHPLAANGETADGRGISVPSGTSPNWVLIDVTTLTFTKGYGPSGDGSYNLDLHNNAHLRFAGDYAVTVFAGAQTQVSTKYVKHIHFNNSVPTTVTDLLDGERGQVATLTFANANTTIAHNGGGTGNIRLYVPTDFTPQSGTATLTLVYNGSLWVDSRLAVPHTTTFSAGETSVSAAGRRALHFNNSGATTVTTITQGVAGQQITITFSNSNTTLVHGTGNLLLEGNANYVGGSSLVRELVYNGLNWIDTLRSKTIVTDAVVVSDDQTTLNVAKIANVRLANTVATDLATLTGGVNGQQVTITFSNSNTTLKHGTGNLQLLSDADIVGQSSKVVLLVYNGTNWVDVRR